MKTPKRILIVDDVPDNLSVLFEFLSARGFEVLAADSGELAIEQLPHSRPDLILLDVMMPGIDGFETCRRIKAEAAWADVPLFFLTALDDTVDKVRGFALGAVDYITKPIDPDEMLARIEAHLELRALRVALEVRNEELDREVQRRVAAERMLGRTLAEAVLVLDAAGEVVFRTEAAGNLLARHGGLPEVAVRRGWANGKEAMAWTTAAGGRGGVVRVECRPDPSGGANVLVGLTEVKRGGGPEDLLVLGITPREAEVLFWIARGKTSPEIAVILAAATATVKRHVANLLPKLGVETRLAAALRAMEILGDANGSGRERRDE